LRERRLEVEVRLAIGGAEARAAPRAGDPGRLDRGEAKEGRQQLIREPRVLEDREDARGLSAHDPARAEDPHGPGVLHVQAWKHGTRAANLDAKWVRGARSSPRAKVGRGTSAGT